MSTISLLWNSTPQNRTSALAPEHGPMTKFAPGGLARTFYSCNGFAYSPTALRGVHSLESQTFMSGSCKKVPAQMRKWKTIRIEEILASNSL